MTPAHEKILKPHLTFKRVFGEHPDLVMSLHNALLPLTPEQEITDIEYLPSGDQREHSRNSGRTVI